MGAAGRRGTRREEEPVHDWTQRRARVRAAGPFTLLVGYQRSAAACDSSRLCPQAQQRARSGYRAVAGEMRVCGAGGAYGGGVAEKGGCCRHRPQWRTGRRATLAAHARRIRATRGAAVSMSFTVPPRGRLRAPCPPPPPPPPRPLKGRNRLRPTLRRGNAGRRDPRAAPLGGDRRGRHPPPFFAPPARVRGAVWLAAPPTQRAPS